MRERELGGRLGLQIWRQQTHWRYDFARTERGADRIVQ
jgi:hypothetical protein